MPSFCRRTPQRQLKNVAICAAMLTIARAQLLRQADPDLLRACRHRLEGCARSAQASTEEEDGQAQPRTHSMSLDVGIRVHVGVLYFSTVIAV